jgi:hypothetical protein
MNLTKTLQHLAMAGMLFIANIGKGQTVYMNFDSVSPGAGIDATAYLASFGIALTNVSQAGSVYIVGDTNYYGTGAVTASSPHNFLLQSVSASSCSYTLVFSVPLQSVTFTRIAISGGFSTPIWTATAYAGANAVGSVGVNSIDGDTGQPAHTYTISGHGITSLTINGNGFGFTAAASAPLDDFYMTPDVALGIAAAGSQSVLYWPAGATNYTLQSTTNIAGGNWTTVTNGTPIIGVTLSNNVPTRFFRLQAN